MTVWNGSGYVDIAGTVQSFTTSEITSGSGSSEAYRSSFLYGFEIPATSVSLSTSDTKYNGMYCHSTVSETYGETKACIYNVSGTQRIVTHTFSYNSSVLPNYTMLYDYNKRAALWVAYEENSSTYKNNNVGRNEGWAYDPAIPEDYQPNLSSSYTGSYDRGHQVASNDRQTTTNQNKQTFYYSNMTPQNNSLNSGSWASLETAVQNLAKSTTDSQTVYVVTGPIFGSGYTSTTDKSGNSCPIPTKYYKCVVLCTLNSSGTPTSAKGCGYVFDHDGTSSARQEMTIDEVETLTGFDFFTSLPDSIETAMESTKGLSL